MEHCRWKLCAASALFVAVAFTVRADEPPPKRVTINKKTFEIYPADELRARGLTVPDIPDDRNAAWVYVEAMNAFVRTPKELGEAYRQAEAGTWPEGEAGDQLAEWLERNRAALDLTRRAAEMPDYYMPLFRGDSDALIMALLPLASKQRQLAKLLRIDATHKLSQGDAAGALDVYLTAQRMGHQIARSNTLIEGLVGMAVTGLAEQGFMRIAESGLADAETLQAASAELDKLEPSFPDWEWMIRAEQAWASSMIDDALDIPGALTMVTYGHDGGKAKLPADTGWNRLYARLRRLYLPDRAMKKHLSDHFDAMVSATKHADGAIGMSIDERELAMRTPAWDVLVRVIVPSLARSHELTLRAKSNFVRARTALAVAAYRKETGRRPPSLAALVPRHLPAVPIDPMTGHELEPASGTEKAGATGIVLVTRDMEERLRLKRKQPVTGRSRKSRWRRYAEVFSARYDLTTTQRSSADAIVRDMETRAERFERSRADAIDRFASTGQHRRLAQTLAPLEAMFEEMRRRLDAVPTAEQRAAAERESRP